jgi:hypothetical protein
MYPLVDIKEIKTEIWGKDLTTPTDEAMLKIAAGIHAVEVRLKQKRQLSSTRAGGPAQPASKMARLEEEEQPRTVTLDYPAEPGSQQG